MSDYSAKPSPNPALPALPALPPDSQLMLLNDAEKLMTAADSAADAPAPAAIAVELPAGGVRMIRRVLFCVGIVALLGCIPLVGVWYFFIYPNMMPGPAANVPVAETSTTASAAPVGYLWMVLVSIAFISAIFIFSAGIYLLEAAHILYGRTRFVISESGIDLQRLIFGKHLRLGERFIDAEDIQALQLRPDRENRYGSIRLTVEHQHPLDLAEEVPVADREWLAQVIQQQFKIG